jgi:hypothetical protein
MAKEADWQSRGLRFLMFGTQAAVESKLLDFAPAWADVKASLLETGLVIDLSSAGFEVRGGVLRPAQPPAENK